jgi:hypothetical protein
MLHERGELRINLYVAAAYVVEVAFSKEDGIGAIELVGVVIAVITACAVENASHAVDTLLENAGEISVPLQHNPPGPSRDTRVVL